MTQLEVLAKEMFDRYAERVAGHRSSWDYLSKDRKIAWMQEVIIMLDHLNGNFRASINKKPQPTRGSGFENGLCAGILQERQDMLNMIQRLEESLSKDLETFRNEK